MILSPAIAPRPTKLQFGIYRDGDNNLDAVQARVVDQAFAASKADPAIAFDVEDFTRRSDFAAGSGARTECYDIREGAVEGTVRESRPRNPSSRAELAAFVAHTLDEAERNGARQTWLDLVDHGGADAGGLENHLGKLMRADDMAGAIADGAALHAAAHPEDAARRVDGVVANECLMSTLGFADALSHAGVRYLAASPETMLAPGVPTGVAEAIASHEGDPGAMADAVVQQTMNTRYRLGGSAYGPAAAFDVLDCDPHAIGAMERAVAALDASLAAACADPGVKRAACSDVHSVDGMARFTTGTMPYKADRPALALYGAFARDAALPDAVRAAADDAAGAVRALVLAHAESRAFAPFGGTSYSDAQGPTVHVAASRAERDPWAPTISETTTAFYAKVGGLALDRALGTTV